MDKAKIRNKIKNIRKSMSNELVNNLSISIINNVINLIDNIDNDNYFIYKSFSNEVNTHLLIRYLLNNKKKVFLPRIDNEIMLSIPYKENTSTKTNKFGIEEPLGEPINIDNFICIMPLLAVDTKGNRIGFGKGYYDRFLKNKKCLKIGLCYEYQILNNTIQTNPFDIPLDIIVSEKGIIKIQQNNKTKRE